MMCNGAWCDHLFFLQEVGTSTLYSLFWRCDDLFSKWFQTHQTFMDLFCLSLQETIDHRSHWKFGTIINQLNSADLKVEDMWGISLEEKFISRVFSKSKMRFPRPKKSNPRVQLLETSVSSVVILELGFCFFLKGDFFRCTSGKLPWNHRILFFFGVIMVNHHFYITIWGGKKFLSTFFPPETQTSIKQIQGEVGVGSNAWKKGMFSPFFHHKMRWRFLGVESVHFIEFQKKHLQLDPKIAWLFGMFFLGWRCCILPSDT